MRHSGTQHQSRIAYTLASIKAPFWMNTYTVSLDLDSDETTVNIFLFKIVSTK